MNLQGVLIIVNRFLLEWWNFLITIARTYRFMLSLNLKNKPIKKPIKEFIMTKEVVKHRKDEKKKATLTAKEKKVKKQEKKAAKK